jgi:quinohemoprotein amine dehydrogenase beta subunit
MKTIIKPIYLLSLLGTLLLALGPAQAKDMILTAIKPNRIIIADPDSMKITRQIEVENAGPSISTVVPSRDGKSAFMSGNKFESIIKIDLDSGKELMRIDLSDDATRVKAMFGMDVSPDDSTIAVYENPVEIMKSEYRVLSTRISLYDANTGALKARSDAPRQITVLAYSGDGSRLYGMGRALHIFDGKSGSKIGEHKTQEWGRSNFYPPDILSVWQQWESAGMFTTPYYSARSDMDLADPAAYWTGILRLDLDTGKFSMTDVENTDVFYFSSTAHPGNKNIVYATYNNLTKLDAESGKPLKRIDLPHSYYATNITTDGKKVIIGGAMGDIRIFDSESLEELGVIDMPGGANMGLANLRVFQQ